MNKVKTWLYTAYGDYNVRTGRPFKIQIYVRGLNKKSARSNGRSQLKHTFRQLKRDCVDPMEER